MLAVAREHLDVAASLARGSGQLLQGRVLLRRECGTRWTRTDATTPSGALSRKREGCGMAVTAQLLFSNCDGSAEAGRAASGQRSQAAMPLRMQLIVH